MRPIAVRHAAATPRIPLPAPLRRPFARRHPLNAKAVSSTSFSCSYGGGRAAVNAMRFSSDWSIRTAIDFRNSTQDAEVREEMRSKGFPRMCIIRQSGRVPKLLALARLTTIFSPASGCIRPLGAHPVYPAGWSRSRATSNRRDGETGLDYYRVSGYLEWQGQRFGPHTGRARMRQAPVSILAKLPKTRCLSCGKRCIEVGGSTVPRIAGGPTQAIALGSISPYRHRDLPNCRGLEDVARHVR